MKARVLKGKPLWFRIVFWIISGLALLIVGVLGLGNIVKFPVYASYYKASTTLFRIPGLNDNFIPQGIAASEENDVYLVSGYMSSKTNSRVYVVSNDNSVHCTKLTKNGEPFTSHCGGVATSGDKVFISVGRKIYTCNLNDFLNKSEYVDVGNGIEVENRASFVFSNEEYLFVGEFHDDGYETNHSFETPVGEQNAIIEKFALNDLTKPVAIYTAPDKVQGMAISKDGKIVLSTSRGFNTSHIYVYDDKGIHLSNETFLDAPLYNLTTPILDLRCPPMTEDLDIVDNKVVTLTESACNKMFLGKLFGANKAFALDILS